MVVSIIKTTALMHTKVTSVTYQRRPAKNAGMVSIPVTWTVETRPALVFPAWKLVHVPPTVMVPSWSICPIVPVVISRRQLSLITRWQVLRILSMLRIGAARVVLVGAAFDAITAAIRLVDPNATSRIRTRGASEPEPYE